MLTLALLYAALCDPAYDRREQAEARLVAIIHRSPSLYGPRLATWCREASCPEVRCRTLRVLAVYERWRVLSYVPSTTPLWPICDAWPLPNVALPAFALEDVRDRWAVPSVDAAGVAAGPAWSRYRAGTERAIRDRLRQGWTWEQCDQVLARAWRLEQRAKHDCGVVLHAVGWSGGYLGRVPAGTSP